MLMLQPEAEKVRDQANRNECRLERYPQYGEDCVGCSVCGYIADRYIFEETNSCPNCGRKVIQ